MLQHYLPILFTTTPIPVPGTGGFVDYDSLRSSIASWLRRDDDTDFANRVPDFIRLTEARLNRMLRDADQIVTSTVAIVSGQGTLPADFGEMVAFGDSGRRLRSVTPAEYGAYYPFNGESAVYSLSGNYINVLGSGSSLTPITYYRAIPPLSDANPTNWLLDRAPDLYLYGSLLQAEFYGWNDERLGFIKGAFDEAISELRADGANRRWGAAPLTARIRRQ